jgi:hypothetical protein
MFKRIYAIFVSRNREFVRDRSSLAWNLLLPVGLVLGLSFAFDGQRDEYTVGVLQAEAEIDPTSHPFLETRYIGFVPYDDDIDEALRKVERHQLDLLIDPGPPVRYWINPTAPKGYFIEFALLQASAPMPNSVIKEQIEGDPVRYADWILPGILGMNMMFSRSIPEERFPEAPACHAVDLFRVHHGPGCLAHGPDHDHYLVRLYRHAPASEYPHGGQLFHAISRRPCRGYFDGLAGVDRIRTGNQ